MKPPEAEPAAESPFKGKTGVTRMINALSYSTDGLAAAWRYEDAFRIEVMLAAVLIPLACWAPITPVERAILIGAVFVVLIVELVNSSIEAAVDRISLERHPLAKRAKDGGSAAVMVSLVMCASVWAIILFPRL